MRVKAPEYMFINNDYSQKIQIVLCYYHIDLYYKLHYTLFTTP